MSDRAAGQRGLTLLEVLIAALVMSVVAGGMLMTFLLVSRLSRGGSAPLDRAGRLAQQTLERFRNRIACDDVWFDPGTPTCVATALPPAGTADPLPESATDMGGRTYTITANDCDGDGVAGDCFQMAATITGVSE